MKPARAVWLGRRAYRAVHELQEALHERRREDAIGDVVLLVEHEPVITLGRSADPSHVLAAETTLARNGVDLVKTGRGGDVTYHGPGQLVCYPILDLKPDRCDVRKYVRSLADAMVFIARDYGVEAGCMPGAIGVWADADDHERWAGPEWAGRLVKIGAIGVRLSRWVTMHGFALNLSTDLDAFDLIVPCGIRDRKVASLKSLAGAVPSVAEVALSSAPALSRALDMELDPIADRAGASLSVDDVCAS